MTNNFDVICHPPLDRYICISCLAAMLSFPLSVSIICIWWNCFWASRGRKLVVAAIKLQQQPVIRYSEIIHVCTHCTVYDVMTNSFRSANRRSYCAHSRTSQRPTSDQNVLMMQQRSSAGGFLPPKRNIMAKQHYDTFY